MMISEKMTRSAKTGEGGRDWLVVDATGLTLGRLASKIASAIRGKNKVSFTPHADVGDFVVVINADKVVLTGNKMDDKQYHWHSEYPGGLSTRSAREMLATRPEEVFRRAVWGMLPKNRLGRQLITKLKVYAGPHHPHSAQQPQPLA
ncbi:MAG: 50S ribosomal protein L13 [Myxococcota bacterium]